MSKQDTELGSNGVSVGIPKDTPSISSSGVDSKLDNTPDNTPGNTSGITTAVSVVSEPKPKRYVMYILVNTDLKMEKGKIAGQVGHVVGIITEEIIRKAYESVTPETMEDYQHYENWIKKDMYTKVVLKATEAQLRQEIATEKKCRYIIDAGRTQIAPNSLTVVGFFPRNDLEEKMKQYKLL